MKEGPHKLKGNKNYKNIVIGRVKIPQINQLTAFIYTIKNVEDEVNNLLKAINNVKKEIKNLQKKTSNNKEIYDIFDFYKMYLEDEHYIETLTKEISDKKINAAYVVQSQNQKTIDFFDALKDPKMRDKKNDINFLTQKILKELLKVSFNKKFSNKKNTKTKDIIIFANDISPLDLINYYYQDIKAIITQEGTFTSHSSIIANTLNISYMIGVKDCINQVKNDDIVIVDGFSGDIIINPDQYTINEYEKKKENQKIILKKLEDDTCKKSFTKDKKYIKIMSNIDVIDLPETISKYNFEGIGLIRSEFIFHGIKDIPDYEEQLTVYKELLLRNKDIDVTIRTFDFTEDKTPNTLKKFTQTNPSLGLRGVRLSFSLEIFKTQLKALIKASEFGKLKILFPMVTTYKEVIKIKQIEKEILEELNIEKTYKLGIMIETVSSFYMLEDIYEEIDFISLGTNDLMQYFFAVDRDNSLIKDLSSPFDNSFIRFLKNITQSIKKYDLELSICGRIASTPNIIPILIGVGLEILSVDLGSIPIIKEVISKISYKESKELINILLKNYKNIDNPKFLSNETIVNEFLKTNKFLISN